MRQSSTMSLSMRIDGREYKLSRLGTSINCKSILGLICDREWTKVIGKMNKSVGGIAAQCELRNHRWHHSLAVELSSRIYIQQNHLIWASFMWMNPKILHARHLNELQNVTSQYRNHVIMWNLTVILRFCGHRKWEKFSLYVAIRAKKTLLHFRTISSYNLFIKIIITMDTRTDVSISRDLIPSHDILLSWTMDETKRFGEFGCQRKLGRMQTEGNRESTRRRRELLTKKKIYWKLVRNLLNNVRRWIWK